MSGMTHVHALLGQLELRHQLAAHAEWALRAGPHRELAVVPSAPPRAAPAGGARCRQSCKVTSPAPVAAPPSRVLLEIGVDVAARWLRGRRRPFRAQCGQGFRYRLGIGAPLPPPHRRRTPASAKPGRRAPPSPGMRRRPIDRAMPVSRRIAAGTESSHTTCRGRFVSDGYLARPSRSRGGDFGHRGPRTFHSAAGVSGTFAAIVWTSFLPLRQFAESGRAAAGGRLCRWQSKWTRGRPFHSAPPGPSASRARWPPPAASAATYWAWSGCPPCPRRRA